MNYRSVIKTIVLYSGYLFHRNHDSKVVFYHDVGNKYTAMGTPLELIKAHINQIRKSGFDIVNSIEKRQNQVMICFDDGWSGLYDSKDYFINEQIFPTVFVAVDLIGSKGHMTADQIKEMANMGFLFEAHSWSHDDLTNCDDEGLHKELLEAKETMEQMLSLRFDSVCFPKGLYNEKVVAASKKYGYKRLFSSIWGSYYDKKEDGIICRILAQDLSVNNVKYAILGRSPYLTKRYFKQHNINRNNNG